MFRMHLPLFVASSFPSFPLLSLSLSPSLSLSLSLPPPSPSALPCPPVVELSMQDVAAALPFLAPHSPPSPLDSSACSAIINGCQGTACPT